MENLGVNPMLFAAQLLNVALLVAMVVLAVLALLRLGRAQLSQAQRLGWAALVLLVPFLGALAALLLLPRDGLRPRP